MATYYWVGGTGNWDATTTTNWSLSSGGAGGAGVPTSADNVIFNSASNATAYTVNVGTNAVCNDVSISGPGTGNVAITSGATAILNCYGSWTNAATGVAFSSASSALFFQATATGKTVTTNNVTFGNMAVYFLGVGGGWTLGSAITTTGSLVFSAGAFDSGNFAINAAGFARAVATTASVSLGSSTCTITGAATAVSFTNTTGLTFNAGTSTISFSGTAPVLNAGGVSFYNLSFTSTASTAVTLTNIPVANNIVFAPRAAAGIRLITISVNLSCNNISWGAPATVNIRNGFASVTRGTQVSLTIAAPTAVANVDFRDINYASGTMTGTSLGNAGNNSNITFTAAKTVYWNLVAGGNWMTSTAWATSSGGAPAIANFPLAQDTAIIENTGLTAGNTITVTLTAYYPTVDMSTRTANMTFATGTVTLLVCGNLTFQSSGVLTLTGTGTIVFASPSATQTITTNGVTFTQALNFSATPGNSVVLNGAVTTSDNITLTVGTLNLAGYTLTARGFVCSATTVKVLAFGTGKIVLTGNNITILSGSGSTIANMTVTGTAPLIEFSYAGSTGLRNIVMPALNEANAISVSIIGGGVGTGDAVAIQGVLAAYKNITFTNFYGTTSTANTPSIYGDLVFNAGMATTAATNNLTFASTLTTQKITTNGVVINFPITLTASLQLQDALTLGAARVFTLTSGTLDMANNTLTVGFFSSVNSNVRSVIFGTAQMYLTGNAGTIWAATTATNFSYTGTGIVNLTYAGSTGQRVIGHGSTGGTEANTPSFNVTAGTDNFAFNSNTRAKDLNFTGWGASGVGVLTFNTFFIYGSLTLGPGSVTASIANSVSFIGTSGGNTITSNGVAFRQNLIINGPGGTWQLGDGLFVDAARTITLTSGTFVLNGLQAQAGFFNSNNTNVRTLDLSGSVFYVAGAGTSWDCTTTTNLTIIPDFGTISMGSSSPKTFAGGGATYGSLYQSGAGDLTITGANTFNVLGNLYAPSTVTTAGNTVVTNFTLSGSGVDLVTFDGGSNTISQASGAVGPTNLLIKNSSAIGGAIWTAFPSLGNIDGGNNTGWIFTSPAPSGTGPGFFSFFD